MSEYSYRNLTIYNPVTGHTVSAPLESIDENPFKKIIVEDTYTVTEEDVLAAIANGKNFDAQEVSVSCDGDQGTILVDWANNFLNVYKENIASEYEPFLDLTIARNSSSFSDNVSIQYSAQIKNNTGSIVRNASVSSSLTNSTVQVTLQPLEIKNVAFQYVPDETEMETGSLTDTIEVAGTSFLNTEIALRKTATFTAAPANPKLLLVYTNENNVSVDEYTVGDTAAYTFTATNAGNITLHNILVHDNVSDEDFTVDFLRPNESRSWVRTHLLQTTEVIERISGSISGTTAGGTEADVEVIELQCYVDIAMGWLIKVQVDSSTSYRSAVPFNLSTQDGIELTVEWGDGTTTTHVASQYDPRNSTASWHTYSEAGTYTIKIISNDWENTYIGGDVSNSGQSSDNRSGYIYFYRQTLVEVLNPIPPIKGAKYLNGVDFSVFSTYTGRIPNLFYFCRKLRRVPASLFKNLASCTTFDRVFNGCYALTSIPEHLLDPLVNLTSLSSAFSNCTGLTSIPVEVFKYNVNVTSFSSCFYGCTGLTSIPEDIFKYNTAATSFYYCFSGCTGLTSISENIFKYNTEATSFSYCFNNTTMTSIPENIFQYNTAATSFSYCFYGCINLSTIPENLFKNNTAVTSFDYCFYGCTNLTSIPANLFRYNPSVSTFMCCFYNCTGLTTVPEDLFRYNTVVTSFQSTFSNCTGINSIPENLFRYNTSATVFYYCFSKSNITSIPENLFRYNAYGRSFTGVFANCPLLNSIPEDLFRYNESATTFESCFTGCTSLNGFTLRIASPNVTSANSFCSYKSGTSRTVYVPSGSTTASTFSGVSSSLGLTIIGE